MKLSKQLIILLLISVISLWPLFSHGFFPSQDGELHLARIVAYSQALKAGQFPVRWARDLNYHYGYPIFNFVYPLPYLTSAILYLSGFSMVVSLKVVLALSLVLSGIFMFKAVSLWLNNKWAGFVAAIFYLFAPYRFLDVYVRVALGEAVAFVFPPLILWGFFLWQKKNQFNGWLVIVLALAGLILSHNALAIMFLPFLLIFMILEMKLNKDNLLWLGGGVIIGFGLSALFWLPAFLELKYTLAQYYLSQKDFHDYFVSLKNLVYMPWGFTKESTPTYLGVIGFLVFFLFIWNLINRKINFLKGTSFALFWLISIFLILPWSVFLWEKLPILPFFQTPWRFLSLTVLVTSLMGGWLVKSQPLPWLWVIVTILTIGLALPTIRVWRQEKINEEFYRTYPKSTTWHNEGSPVWTAGEADRYPENPYQIIGKAKVENWFKGDTQHLMKVSAQESVRAIDETIYFPGWRVFIDKKEVPIQFQDPLYRGLITFKVPAGEHEIEVVFGRTKLRLMAELISLGSLIGLFLAMFTFKMKFKEPK